MNETNHSVKLIEEYCRGCTKCMINCPVEAVRLKNSKALIYTDRCIDCGECIKVCPYNAHVAEKDSLSDIEKFRVKIAIPSVTLYSQFGDFVNPAIVNDAIKSIGFYDVYDITYACDIASVITKKEIEKAQKPAISNFCPTVVRLIHSNYPELVEHLINVLTPVEIEASLIREKYEGEGYMPEEIGVFYLTPCVTWVTQAKNSSGNKKTRINGSIAISDIYPKLFKYINKNKNSSIPVPAGMSFTGLYWAASGGQSKSMNLKEYIAVDGVDNVIKLLNSIGKGKFDDVDFIEALACSGGCLGGLLLVDNPYNSKRILKKYFNYLNFTYSIDSTSREYEGKFLNNNENKKIYNQKLADDFESAVKKMKYMNTLINTLPGIDCGQCGSPSCKAFAEDVVRGLSMVEDCKMLNKGEIKDEG